jgi:hypothetical protein
LSFLLPLRQLYHVFKLFPLSLLSFLHSKSVIITPKGELSPTLASLLCTSTSPTPDPSPALVGHVTISDVLKMFSLPYPANLTVEEALGKIEGNLGKIEGKLGKIEGKLGEINEKLGKRGDEAKLKKTLERLEAQGRDLNARLLNLDARLKVQEEETASNRTTSTSGFVFQSYPGVCLRV